MPWRRPWIHGAFVQGVGCLMDRGSFSTDRRGRMGFKGERFSLLLRSNLYVAAGLGFAPSSPRGSGTGCTGCVLPGKDAARFYRATA